VEVPVFFQGDGGAFNMGFSLGALRADATPIDWNALEASLRPPGMADDLWAALWRNFRDIMGTTWADYQRQVIKCGNSLDRSGQSGFRMADIIAAVFSEASGGAYRRTLASAVDAQAPAPGLPLSFRRFTTDGLEQRFGLGPLGRGWSHNFEYALSQPANNVVLIRSPGGGGRRFTLGTDGAWKADVGDYGTLSPLLGGGFLVREKTGQAWEFNAQGKLVTLADPNGNTITLTYTGNQLTRLAHSAGPAFTLAYNAQGRLSQLTDHAGQVTAYAYDAAGEHLASVTAPGAVVPSRTARTSSSLGMRAGGWPRSPGTATPSDLRIATATGASSRSRMRTKPRSRCNWATGARCSPWRTRSGGRCR
jgi:YD repeat-containing protein